MFNKNVVRCTIKATDYMAFSTFAPVPSGIWFKTAFIIENKSERSDEV